MATGRLLCSLLAAATVAATGAFQPGAFLLPARGRVSPQSTTHLHSDSSDTRGRNGKTKFGQKTDADVSRFLTDFRTADGKVVDPYKMLQVERSATTIEIKQSYYRLSRKLHPDRVAQSDILPGKCETLDDVREEWERVKFSYEILRDPKVRKSYDRNSSVASVLEDPGGAMGRAVVGGALGGMGMVLGGMWKVGEMATKVVYETATAEREEPPSRKERIPQVTEERAPVAVGQTTIEPKGAPAGIEATASMPETLVAKENGITNKSTAATDDRHAINMITPETTQASGRRQKKAPKGGAKGFAKK